MNANLSKDIGQYHEQVCTAQNVDTAAVVTRSPGFGVEEPWEENGILLGVMLKAGADIIAGPALAGRAAGRAKSGRAPSTWSTRE